MSLYRKYRPKSFADVLGQDHIVTTLENAVSQDKLTHAYLFSGARGTGKTSVARILAGLLLTKGVEDEVIKKQILQAIEEGNLVDLIEIDAASNRGIDDIRELVEKIQFSPVVAKAKVYIIDEVHMLTREAFNALLKTLEEPPSYAYFILATTELQKIPATIQSRCQRFAFRQIREEDIVRGLQNIADKEHVTIDRAALRAISLHAQGGMRDAISLLDQLRSLEKIDLKDVKERIGEGGQEHIDRLFSAIDSSDRAVIIEIVRDVEDTGMALDILVRQLLSSVRERLHEAVAAGESTDHHSEILQTLLTCLRDMRSAPVPGLVLETALLSLCEKSGDQPGKKPMLLRKTKAEEPVPQEPAEAMTVASSENAEEPAVADALIEAPDLSLDTLSKAWPTIIDETTPASVRMSLKNGRVLGLKNSRVIVSFSSSFHKEKVAHTEASRAIEAVMEKIFKRSLQLECIVDSSDKMGVKSSADSVNLADAAAEIF